ncbi:unnamed protein product [Cylindrotheca closterium]|uniref:DUF7640 domain-containing protein n=1 Tax=Cylindrotheca closterium TaxID=2856 RepID=A0AAD2GDP4_9STRA|nr:unnamed protein product [Cylindrotheca closterium]
MGTDIHEKRHHSGDVLGGREAKVSYVDLKMDETGHTEPTEADDSIQKDSSSSASRRSKYSRSSKSSRRSSKTSRGSRSPMKNDKHSSGSRRHRSHRSRSGSGSRGSSMSRSRSRSLEMSLNGSDDEEEVIKRSRKAPKGASKEFRDRARRNESSRRVSSGDFSIQSSILSKATATTNTTLTETSTSGTYADMLYGGDSDEDAKQKSKSSSSSKASKPGVERVTKRGDGKRHHDTIDRSIRSKDSGTTNTSNSVEILYGGDSGEDAKAKAKSSRSSRASEPGMERISKHSSSSSKRHVDRSIRSKDSATSNASKSVDLLYGDRDEDAKQKAKSGHRSSRSSRPGIERSDHHKMSKMDLLYGDDQGKAKSSRRKVSQPGVEEVHDSDEKGSDTRELLYGKSKSSKRSSTRGMVEEQDSSSETRDLMANDGSGDEAPEAAVMGETVQENKGSRKSKLWIIIGVLAFCFLLIVGGVVAFVVLRENSEDVARSVDDTPAPSTFLGQFSPTIIPPTTAANTTNPPTSSPTPLQIYDAPSPENCQSIANNQTIAGQENMTQSDINIKMDVTLSVHGEVSDEMVQELLDALQQIFLPALAGCDDVVEENVEQEENVNDTERRSLMRGSSSHQNRQLANGAPQYVIFNAFVSEIEQSERDCEDEETEDPADEGLSRCYRLIVEVSMYLKGPTQFFEIASLISQQAEKEPNLVIPFDLPDPFSEVKLIGVDSLIPIQSPSAMPTDVPSTAPSIMPSETPSASPSSSPTSMPVVGPTPPPSVSPTVLGSSSPSKKPSIAPSPPPTVRASELPSAMPSNAPTGAPVIGSLSPSIPIESNTPSQAPSPASSANPSLNPSSAPSLVTSQSPTRYPTSSPTSSPTEWTSVSMAPSAKCYCIDVPSAPSCDGTVANHDIGCDSCIGSYSCAYMQSSPDSIPTIGASSCKGDSACGFATVVSIGDNSCHGLYSCEGRLIEAGSGSCTSNYACTGDFWGSTLSTLSAGGQSCNGEYSCYSHELAVRSQSCKDTFACAGRAKMFVADNACQGNNACSGAVLSVGSLYQAQTETSYFGNGSCTCPTCCTCMIRVVSGRCTTPGECCDVDDPTAKAAGVQDNTEEEMRQDLGVTDLLSLF